MHIDHRDLGSIDVCGSSLTKCSNSFALHHHRPLLNCSIHNISLSETEMNIKVSVGNILTLIMLIL